MGVEFPHEGILTDKVPMMLPGPSKEQWVAAYEKMLTSLPPGSYQLIVHLGFDTMNCALQLPVIPILGLHGAKETSTWSAALSFNASSKTRNSYWSRGAIGQSAAGKLAAITTFGGIGNRDMAAPVPPRVVALLGWKSCSPL